jgi:GMP synthase-like glutamine amidotransferase
MKPVRIFRHVDCEGPGYFASVLQRCHVPYHVIAIDRGEAVPQSLDDVSGLVFMGGPMSVNDSLDWIAAELDLIQRAIAVELPVLGHCLGGQLISKALAGTVTRNRVREIGWHEVWSQNNPAAHDWLAGIEPFEAFHWHGETFSIPERATAILSSRHCENQAFVLGNTLALQCHIEMTPGLINEWLERYAEELAKPSDSLQSAETIRQKLEKRVEILQSIADRIYARWLKPILERVEVSG